MRESADEGDREVHHGLAEGAIKIIKGMVLKPDDRPARFTKGAQELTF